MLKLKQFTTIIGCTILLFTNSTLYAGGGVAGGLASDFTKLHLTILQGAISSEEDFTALEPGLYEFIVANKTSDKAVFEIQDLKTEKVLGEIKIRPNKSKKTRVKITKNGFRYRKSNDVWQEFKVN